MLRPISWRRGCLRLLLERDDQTLAVEAEDTHLRGGLHIDRLRRDGDVRFPGLVSVDELAVIHSIEMIAGEDEVIVGLVLSDMAHGLAHRVGCSLKPVRIVGRLLGGEDLDEPARELIEAVGVRDVAVE